MTQRANVCRKCWKMYYPGTIRKRPCEPELVDDSSSSSSEPSEKSVSLCVFVNPLIPGMVKIGMALCPVTRAQSMSQSHPFCLTVFQTYYQMGCLESTAHRRLSDRRVTSGPGREWFWATPDEADLIVRPTILEHMWKSVVCQA